MSYKNKDYIINFFCLLIFLLSSSVCLAKDSKIKWNDGNVKWHTYEKGLELARINQKPAIVIFYADWCPTCKTYGKTFHQDQIVKATSDFIMIRVNKDDNPTLSKTYRFDGEYIPRTFAVSSKGKVMHHLYAEKGYKYYIGVDSRSLLSLMRKALKHN